MFVFPTWWYGMPAMLKGYIDRVWVPGVAFEAPAAAGRCRSCSNIMRFGVVTTYGSPWWLNKLIGDPCRSALMRGIRLLCAERAHTLWLAQYGMDDITADARERFLAQGRATDARGSERLRRRRCAGRHWWPVGFPSRTDRDMPQREQRLGDRPMLVVQVGRRQRPVQAPARSTSAARAFCIALPLA